jgi:hypothetical protein
MPIINYHFVQNRTKYTLLSASVHKHIGHYSICRRYSQSGHSPYIVPSQDITCALLAFDETNDLTSKT